MELDKKTILILGILALMILSFGASFYLLKGIKVSSKELFLAKEESVIIQEKINQTATLKEKFSLLENDIEKIKRVFVNPEEIVEFLQFLEQTANTHHILVKISLLSQIDKSKDSFPFLEFQLSLTGSYSNCIQFLGKLESAPYLIEINNLTINKMSEEQLRLEQYKEFTAGAVTLTLIMRVFTNKANSL